MKEEPQQDAVQQDSSGTGGAGKEENPKDKLVVVPDDDKWAIREKVWNYLEKNNLANFPRPVHNRIPNFKGAVPAGEKVATLDVFTKAQTVKINPDKPQEIVRFKVLESMKNLYVPTPRLRTGLFNKITPPPNYDKKMLRRCATSIGTRDYSIPIGLNDKIKVDLVVVGSVAVSNTGLRIGKGEGFADLEFGMMMSMGAVSDDTMIVTTVLDDQIMDLPEELFGEHDLPVDIIVTPNDVIHCPRRNRPKGIIWSLITIEKMKQCPILKILRDRQHEEGVDVTLKDGVEPTEEDLQNAEEERPMRPNMRRRFRRQPPRQHLVMYQGMQMYPYPFVGYFQHPARAFRQTGRRYSVQSKGSGTEEGTVEQPSRPPRRRFNRRGRPAPKNTQMNGEHAQGQDAPTDQAPTTDEEGGSPKARLPRRRRQQRRRPGKSTKEAADEGEDGEKAPRQRPVRRNTASSQEPTDGEASPSRRRRRQGGPSVFVGSIPRGLRVSNFKSEVRGKDVHPIRVVWKGARGFAILQFTSGDEMEAAIEALKGMNINGKDLKVEISTNSKKRDKSETNADAKPPVADPMASGDAPAVHA